jgi:hypothetical protein
VGFAVDNCEPQPLAILKNSDSGAPHHRPRRPTLHRYRFGCNPPYFSHTDVHQVRSRAARRRQRPSSIASPPLSQRRKRAQRRRGGTRGSRHHAASGERSHRGLANPGVGSGLPSLPDLEFAITRHRRRPPWIPGGGGQTHTPSSVLRAARDVAEPETAINGEFRTSLADSPRGSCTRELYGPMCLR